MLWLAWTVATARGGALAGTVIDDEGVPVGGAVVTVFDARGEYGSTTTAPDGTFVVEGLPADRYRVRATAPAGGAGAETWAPFAPERCTGEIYVVGEDHRVEVAVELLPGAILTGVVELPDGAPGAGAVVTAQPATDAVARSVTAGPDGAFTLPGLPGVEVAIAIAHPAVLDQFWGGAYDEDLAVKLRLTLGRATDLGPIPLRPGGTLSGTVFGPDGLPVAYGKVSASAAGVAVSTETGPDGAWTLEHVPSGSALLVADGPDLTATWFPDLSRPGERLPVEDGVAVDGLDFQLATAARVTGVVPGAPWPEDRKVRVRLTSVDGVVAIGAWLLEDGTFSINRLYGGEYTLFVDASERGFLPDVLRDEAGAPRVLAVPDGGALDLGVLDLPLGATITGRVTDAVTGLPVDHAYVIAERAGTELEHVVFAEPDGTYALQGLEPGTWSVYAGFESPCPIGDREWVTFWWPGTPSDLLAGLVEVDAGEVFTWDPAIPPDDDHDQMDDAWELEHGLDPTVDDADEDPDGDGFDNLDEYRLGTDPTDRARGGKGCGCAGGGESALGWVLVALVARRGCRGIVRGRGAVARVSRTGRRGAAGSAGGRA